MPSRRTTRSLVAVSTFHYPDGVAFPGETVELDDEWAHRGVALGALVETAAAAKTAQIPDAVASKTEE